MLSGFSFSSIFTPAGLTSLGQIIVGDLTMAGDNVVIMGSLASGLPEKDRKRVLMLGVGMALAFLITFAVLATQLLKITGLVFAGGLLLLWVAYNMWQELHPRSEEHTSELQSLRHLVCRLLLEKKKRNKNQTIIIHKTRQTYTCQL